jgi:hypothetical protein
LIWSLDKRPCSELGNFPLYLLEAECAPVGGQSCCWDAPLQILYRFKSTSKGRKSVEVYCTVSYEEGILPADV